MLTLQIFLTWILVVVLAIALGLPVALLLKANGPRAVRIALWIGLTLLTILALGISLFAQLRGSAALIVATVAVAITGTVALKQGVLARLCRGWTRPRPLTVGTLLTISLVVLAIGATLAPTHYDFSLYHFSGLSWAAQYGTPVGLANLIDYLGYSNSATPWSAALMNGPAGNKGFAAFAGLWAVALVVDASLRLSSVGSSKQPGTYIAFANVVVLLAPLLIFADIFVASPTSDTAVFALLLVSGAALADGVVRPRNRSHAVVLTLIPLLIAASMRPQILLVAAVSSLVLLVVALRDRHSHTQGGLVLSVAVVSVLGLLLGLASLMRDYRLSGWAVYPLSIFAFDVPWRAEDPTVLRAMTIGIARDPGPGYQNAAEGYAWFVPWVGRQIERWESWAFLALMVVAAFFALAAWRKGRRIRVRSLGLALLPFIVFALTWIFLLPPTWRHSWGAIFGIGTTLIGWFAWRLQLSPRMWAIGAAIATLSVALVALTVRFPTKPTELDSGGHITITTQSGLELLQPTNQDLCGIAPLLCTPMPRGDLRLLGDDLGGGFTRDMW